MVDLATIGYKVDTKGLDAGTTALDEFAATSKTVTGAVAATGPAAATAGKAVGEMGSKAELSALQFNVLSSSARHGFDAFLAGASLTQILTIQFSKLSAAVGESGFTGLLKTAATSVLGLLTPMRLLGVAGAAVALAGYSVYQSWKSTAGVFDDVSRQAGITTQTLHGLEAAASFKGIDTNDFLGAMQKFSEKTYEAKNNMGSLADVMRANGQTAKTFTDYLFTASDLILRAKNDQERLVLLQQLGLPATSEWVRLLSQGRQGLQEQIALAGKLGSAFEDGMVASARRADEEWAKFWKNIDIKSKSWLIGFLDGISGIGDKINSVLLKLNLSTPGSIAGAASQLGTAGKTTFGTSFDDFYRRTGAPANAESGLGGGSAGRGGTTIDPNVLKNNIALQQQQISVMGNLATVTDQVKSKELEINLARLNGVAVTNQQKDAILRYTEAEALGLNMLQQQTNAQRIEAETTFMSTGAAAAYRAEQQLLFSFKQRGITLTEQNIAAIHREAQALGEATQKAETLRQTADLASSGLADFATGMASGKTATEALSGAVKNLTNQLINIASRKLINSLFAGIDVSSAGGGSGIFGSLFGKNAGGTDYWGGGPTWVGEKGPEVVDLPRGSRVTPNSALSGGGSQNVNFTVKIDLEGANGDETIARIAHDSAAQGARFAIDTVRRTSPSTNETYRLMGTTG